MTVEVRTPERLSQPPVWPGAWSSSLVAVVGLGVSDQRRAPLIWGGALGAMGALMAAMWPSIEDSIGDLMRSYPDSLKDAFGIGQLDTVEEYIDAEMLSLIVPLAMAFFAIRSAIRLTVTAEDRRYLDTLLALPLSRQVLAIGSYIATGVVVAGILIVSALLTWIAGTLAGTGISAGTLAVGFANVWPLAMLFAGLAVLVAGFVRRPGIVTGFPMGAVVATYLLDLLGKMTPAMEGARSLSVFRYYGSAIQDGLDVSHATGLVLTGGVLAAIGALLFDRRDLA